jgi:hypothetical protein
VETARTRGGRPKLREALSRLQADDTLVISKPDRVGRSMKELPVLLLPENRPATPVMILAGPPVMPV